MSRALGEYMITGVKTTIPFQQAIMQNSDFRRGTYHTGFVGKGFAKAAFQWSRRVTGGKSPDCRRGCTRHKSPLG